MDRSEPGGDRMLGGALHREPGNRASEIATPAIGSIVARLGDAARGPGGGLALGVDLPHGLAAFQLRVDALGGLLVPARELEGAAEVADLAERIPGVGGL